MFNSIVTNIFCISSILYLLYDSATTIKLSSPLQIGLRDCRINTELYQNIVSGFNCGYFVGFKVDEPKLLTLMVIENS